MPIDGKYFCGRVRYTYEIACVYLCWGIYNFGNCSLGLDCGDIGLDTGIRATVRAVTCRRISSGPWDCSWMFKSLELEAIRDDEDGRESLNNKPQDV